MDIQKQINESQSYLKYHRIFEVIQHLTTVAVNKKPGNLIFFFLYGNVTDYF